MVMTEYTVEIEVKILADSPEDAAENVNYALSLLRNNYRIVGSEITCEPYEEE